MTPEKLKQAQKTLCLNNREMAEALGCSRRGLDNWRGGQRPIPGTVIVIIKMLLKGSGHAVPFD